MNLPIRNGIPGDCGRILLQASALSDGEASPQAALEIRRHLLDCSGCRDRTDEMTRLVAILESLPVFDPSPELEERLLAAVRGKIDTVPRHVEREIYPQVTQIQAKMEQSNEKYRYENQLAVLYARYGLYDRALQSFERIIAENEYVPALINTGNIFNGVRHYKPL